MPSPPGAGRAASFSGPPQPSLSQGFRPKVQRLKTTRCRALNFGPKTDWACALPPRGLEPALGGPRRQRQRGGRADERRAASGQAVAGHESSGAAKKPLDTNYEIASRKTEVYPLPDGAEPVQKNGGFWEAVGKRRESSVRAIGGLIGEPLQVLCWPHFPLWACQVLGNTAPRCEPGLGHKGKNPSQKTEAQFHTQVWSPACRA